MTIQHKSILNTSSSTKANICIPKMYSQCKNNMITNLQNAADYFYGVGLANKAMFCY